MSLATLWLEYVVFLLFVQRFLSMMSGDSPNSHHNELLDFKEGRESPIPTTSKEGATVVQASILVQHDKDKKQDEEDKAISSPMFSNTSCDDCHPSDIDKTMRAEELSCSGREPNDEDGSKKLNGDADKPDGVWMPNKDGTKKPIEDDDENCTIKCLYYTMQCCECTIV